MPDNEDFEYNVEDALGDIHDDISAILALVKAMTVKIDRLLQDDRTIIDKENKIMSELTDAMDRAEAAAKANSEADDSAEKLLVTIAQLLKNTATGGTDPAMVSRVNALADALNSRSAQLGAAVVAGTPAAA